jgi:hypothetical protein
VSQHLLTGIDADELGVGMLREDVFAVIPVPDPRSRMVWAATVLVESASFACSWS